MERYEGWLLRIENWKGHEFAGPEVRQACEHVPWIQLLLEIKWRSFLTFCSHTSTRKALEFRAWCRAFLSASTKAFSAKKYSGIAKIKKGTRPARVIQNRISLLKLYFLKPVCLRLAISPGHIIALPPPVKLFPMTILPYSWKKIQLKYSARPLYGKSRGT